jgi:DNA-binding transcriptional ArsR family regulator
MTNGNSSRTVSQDAPLASADRILDALGDRTRRAILERLRAGPQPVVEIARGLPVGRPAISQHLKLLKEAGLVVDRPVGNRRIYQLNPDGVDALRLQLDRFWTKALAAYKATAEQPTEEVG